MSFPIRQTLRNVGTFAKDYAKKFGGHADSDKISPQFIQQLNDRTEANDKRFLKIKSFKKGGMVHKTGIYRLHKGEAVVPKHVVDKKLWMMSDDGIVKK